MMNFNVLINCISKSIKIFLKEVVWSTGGLTGRQQLSDGKIATDNKQSI